jgi:hypothetical protein
MAINGWPRIPATNVAVNTATSDFYGDALNRETIAKRDLAQLSDGSVELHFPDYAAVRANHHSGIVMSAP